MGSNVQKLKDLRLLPPPANELVPLLSAIAMFTVTTIFLGQEEMQHRWKTYIGSPLLDDGAESKFVFGNWKVYMSMYWGYSLLVQVAEYLFPILKHFKIQPSTSTAWSEVVRMVPLVIFNQLFLALPLLKVSFQILAWRVGEDNVESQLVYKVPTIGRFIITMFIHVLCTEVWFYFVHRMLHSVPILYNHIHKLHHSYKAPSCLESAYVHPVEFTLNSFTVFLIGPLVTGAPLLVQWIWLWTVTFLQVHDHSGYWVPFLPRVLMHDFHHQKPNCCYGVTGMIDAILGTEGMLQDFVQNHQREQQNKTA